jgi:drug/metabolite transporter (DMT)-like permease
LLGLLLIAGAALAFAAMDNSIRLLGRRLPVIFIFWARYAFQAAAMGIWLAWRHGRAGFHSGSPRFQGLRGLLLTATSALSFYGLQHVPAPEFTAVAMLAPLLVIAGAAAWLGEPVRPAQRALVAVGFLGALLVVRPGSGLFGLPALFPAAFAFVFAAFQLLTRRLAGHEPPATTHFYTGATGTLLLLPFLLAGGGEVVAAVTAAPPWALALALLLGVLGTGGHLLLILAFGVAPAATLMPFSYLQIGFATLLGVAIFGVWPDGWSLAGMAVIAASGATAAWLDVRGAPQPGRAGGASGR